MTKRLFIAIVLGLLCLLAACSGKATPTDQQPPQKSEKSGKANPLDILSEDDIAEKAGQYLSSVRKILEATYTNKNGKADEVVVPNAKFSNVAILSKETTDGSLFYYDCTADFNNADWIGTTRFKVRFTSTQSEPSGADAFKVHSIEFAESNAEPSYPLDFSDENIYLLFEDDYFRYKDLATPDDNRSENVDINKDTLRSVKMLEFISDDPDSMYEHYKVELQFVDGLMLQGTMVTYYWPLMWDAKDEGKKQGIEKWSKATDLSGFEQIK